MLFPQGESIQMTSPRLSPMVRAALLSLSLVSALGLGQDSPPSTVPVADKSPSGDPADSVAPLPSDPSEPSHPPDDEQPDDTPNPDAPVPNPDVPGDDLVNPQPAFFVNVAVDREDGRYREGQTLTVRFQVEKESHVYLLYHQVDGTCLMLFPNQAHPDNKLAAKQVVTIPEPGEKFRFRVRAPFGEEALQVLASTQPVAELDVLDASLGRALPVSKEIQESLSTRIRQQPELFGEHRVRLETYEARKLPPTAPPARVGVFLGCNRSANQAADEGDRQFKGSAVAMAKIMTQRGGLDPQRVKVLVDDQATKANFETAISKWLPGVTQPGDVVFIYYCGHGGQIKNLDGTEQDGLDEFVSFYDSVPGADADWDAEMRKKGMTDDALARCLQALPGRQIVLIADTCHGGGLIDARGMSRLFADEASRMRDISGLNTVVITGCLPDEVVTFDTRLDTTLLPIFFIESMEKASGPLTVAEAFENYRKSLGRFMAERFPDSASDVLFAQEPSYLDTALLPIYLVPPTP